MRTLLLTATAAAVSLSGFASSAQAQKPFGINASKYGIAVVDISYIFKKHERFRATMESMKKELESTEAEMKAEREKIAQLQERRDAYNAGSAEYKQLDEDLAREMANFNLKMTRLHKSFVERQAKIIHQTYLEVGDAVKYYATQHNIGLVIRFNGEPADPNRREDVTREINNSVVFQNQIDITGDVLDLLNRDSQQSSTTRVPGSSIPR